MRMLIFVALLSFVPACDESSSSNPDAALDLAATATDLACTRTVGEPCNKAAASGTCGACGSGLECIGATPVCVFVDNDLGH